MPRSYASRRSHHKSRNGCTNCKQRRIKCDEIRPACINCTKRSVACEYAGETLADVEPPSTTPPSSTRPSEPPPVSTPATYYDDLELVHHFSTKTARVLEGDFWSAQLPKTAFKHKWLLHLLLTLSALHLAEEAPSRAMECLHLADQHYSTALRPLLAELQCITEKNAGALFASARVVCFITFARGPEPGQYMIFSTDGAAEWLSILRGVKSLAMQISSLGEDLELGATTSTSGPSLDHVDPSPVDFEDAFDALRSFVVLVSAATDLSDEYVEALDLLEDCFVAKFRGAARAKDKYSRFTFSWIFRLSDRLLAAMQEKKPLALVLYAHFIVLMRNEGERWPLRGWVDHCFEGIREHIHPSYEKWLEWPARASGVTKDV